ncbi:MAG: polyprenyl synthetase family protein [Fimbriimonadales bacterium]|nr:polyprenyl synthetase family protein [Fimbriimonadales bacterium]
MTPVQITKQTLAVPEMLAPILPEMQAVEAFLEAQAETAIPQFSDLTRHLLSAGGKRLRPAMVILCAHASEPSRFGMLYRNGLAGRERLAIIAGCMEMIHMATLIHDDVIDQTFTRRGKPTANALYGNLATVLSGDFILARAMRALALDGDLRIIQKVAQITTDMSEGEVAEVFLRHRLEITEAQYLDIVRRKTAEFLAGCCRIGGYLVDADEATLDTLEQFGRDLGIAFQIIDDLLDYVGDPRVTGKPNGTDFREGFATLPLLHYYHSAAPDERDRLQAEFGTDLSEEQFRYWREQIRLTGSLKYAEAVAEQYRQSALERVNQVPASPIRRTLEEVARFITERKY